ncbi:MAG TPA: LysE family translocator [Pseudolabrys sp.]|nr:LysE family translocator [Pseudolabrys sp.]
MLIALITFAFVTAFTPGPNNIMVTASGVNFGFARTIPHMVGVVVGFLVLLMAAAAGVGALLSAVPALEWILKIAGAAYMLWLAWKVANAGHVSEGEKGPARPWSFLQAFAFQWINPKGVITAMSSIAIYMRPDHWLFDFSLMLAIFAIMTIGSISLWTGFGVALRRLLTDPVRARVFNIAMALLLVVSIVPMVV